MKTPFSLIPLCLLLHCQSPDGAKLLLIPEDHAGHVNMVLVAGQALLEAGHDVHILTSTRHQNIIETFNVSSILVETVEALQKGPDEVEQMLIYGPIATDRKAFFDTLTEGFNDQCKATLEDEGTMEILHDIQFDLVLIDGFEPSRCMYIIPYKLRVKYVTFSSDTHQWSVRVPAMPSAESPLPVKYFEGDPSFWERFIAVVTFARFGFAMLSVSDELIETYAPEMPRTTFEELFLRSELWLIDQNNLCLNTPMVYAPHYQFVGGFTTRPARPLPPEMESFAKGATSGLIVLTFGSFIKRTPPQILEKFMTAFQQIKYKVLMRFDGDLENVPPNVKLSKWLPQNDILGHPNTRLFITHAGNNGQLEAVYHGVPMLSVPLFSEQPFNAQRSEHHGYGRTLNIFNFEVHELVSKINDIMENNTYRKNIQRCSEIYHDFPSAHQKIQFYVEHVLKFGGSHLKPAHLRMPLWQFFMLDVLAFLLMTTTVVAILMMWCCLRMYRKCSKCVAKRRPKSKKD